MVTWCRCGVRVLRCAVTEQVSTISYDRLSFAEGTVLSYGREYDYLLMHVPNDNIETRTLILYVLCWQSVIRPSSSAHVVCMRTATRRRRATVSRPQLDSAPRWPLTGTGSGLVRLATMMAREPCFATACVTRRTHREGMPARDTRAKPRLRPRACSHPAVCVVAPQLRTEESQAWLRRHRHQVRRRPGVLRHGGSGGHVPSRHTLPDAVNVRRPCAKPRGGGAATLMVPRCPRCPASQVPRRLSPGERHRHRCRSVRPSAG